MNEQTCFIMTSNRGSGQYARQEIQNRFPDAKFTTLVSDADDVQLANTTVSWQALSERMHTDEPVFVRHLQPVDISWPIGDCNEALLLAYLVNASNIPDGASVVLHVRRENGASFNMNLPEWSGHVREMLSKQGSLLQSKDAQYAISLYIGTEKIMLGISRTADNLSDWAGGAVRYRKDDQMISRAKFKLLEAEEKFQLDLRQYCEALDLGAAPGGWSSLLLERGLLVTAVDPGALDAQVRRHPAMTYVRKKAEQVQFTDNAFGLLVSDMSWDPLHMAHLIMKVKRALRVGGVAIITVKLLKGKPFKTMERVKEILAGSFSFVAAKQLFHNRNELTFFLLRMDSETSNPQ